MEKLLGAKQIQEEYGFHPSTLKRWEAAGKLGDVARTIGGQRRYARSQIEAIIKQAPTNGSKPPIATVSNNNRPSFQEYGVTGLNRFSGSIFEERLRELRGRPGRLKYREMRLNNPVIAAVFFGLVNALKQPSVRVKPASNKASDQKAAAWLETCLSDMSFSWMDTLDLVLQPMFEQGFSLLELVYKKRLGQTPPDYTLNPARSRYDDGMVGWRKWSPRPAESLADGQEWIYDNHGGIQGINQQPDILGGLVRPLVPYRAFADIEGTESQRGIYSVPIEKLLLFRTTLHPANSPEGMSLLRPMYLAYHFATNLQEIEGIGAERDLAGIPVMYLGDGTTLQGSNNDYDEAKDLVVNLRNDEQTGIVIPHPKMGTAGEGRGVLLELLSTGGRRNWDVGSIVERYEKRMAMSCLAQFIMLGMQQVGSYALSRHQGDLFVLAASAFLQSVADVINRHAVPRLLSYNPFPGLSGYPELAFAPVGIPDLEAVSEFVNKLVERQVLTPDPELERHLRQLGGLPPPLVEVATSQPQSEEKQERAAEETALLLRRLSLAIEPLQELMVISGDEAAQMLRPLVDDLKRALGVQGATGGPGFEQAQAEAERQLGEGLGEGQPVEQAVREYVALLKDWRGLKKNLVKAEPNKQLTRQGRKALRLTDQVEADIRREYEVLVKAILDGMEVQAALALFKIKVMGLLSKALGEAWLMGREGQFGQDEIIRIDEAIAAQEDYLNGFTQELTGKLVATKDKEEMGGILAGSLARVLLYAGAVWSLYNLAKLFKAPPQALYAFVGPNDSRTCVGCAEEVVKKPRPATQIRSPGTLNCLGNCRHEVVRVR